jgi:hypothetical protein
VAVRVHAREAARGGIVSESSKERMSRYRARLASAALYARGDIPAWLVERLFASGMLSDEASRNPSTTFEALLDYLRAQSKAK